MTGCSTGLGVQMAQALANQGCNIVCLARRKALVEQNAALLAQTYGVKAIGVVCDVKKRQDHDTLWKKAKEVFGTVDIWVNNAGVNSPDKPVYELTDKEKTLRVRKALLLDLFVIHYPVCHNQAESS